MAGLMDGLRGRSPNAGGYPQAGRAGVDGQRSVDWRQRMATARAMRQQRPTLPAQASPTAAAAVSGQAPAPMPAGSAATPAMAAYNNRMAPPPVTAGGVAPVAPVGKPQMPQIQTAPQSQQMPGMAPPVPRPPRGM